MSRTERDSAAHGQVMNFIEKQLKWYVYTIAADLANCASQEIHTTKLSRRERALAYILENLTAETTFSFTSTTIDDYDTIIRLLKSKARTPEAVVAYDRILQRIQRAYANPSELTNLRQCVGCGTYYDRNESHVCTNQASRAKDITMAHDDTVMLTDNEPGTNELPA